MGLAVHDRGNMRMLRVTCSFMAALLVATIEARSKSSFARSASIVRFCSAS